MKNREILVVILGKDIFLGDLKSLNLWRNLRWLG